MDEASKDQPQVRRVGRPRKVLPMEEVVRVTECAKSIADPNYADQAKAQALASRIWNGQSPDTLTRTERMERIRKALEAQGLSMESVKL